MDRPILLLVLFSFPFLSLVQFNYSCRAQSTSRTRFSPPSNLADALEFGTYDRRIKDGFKLTQYTTVVVFGASDSDDAHPRDPKYHETLRPAPYFHGRFTNGPVFGEYLGQGILTGYKIPQLNYAFGDATVSNQLVSVNAPDLGAQVASYMHDVKNHMVNRGSKDARVLHLMWIGINDVIQAWSDMVSNSDFDLNDPSKMRSAYEIAGTKLRKTAQVAIEQIRHLVRDTAVNSIATDYVVMLLPPLELVPNLRYQSMEKAKKDPSRAAVYLDYVGRLTEVYNEGLRVQGDQLAKSTPSARRGAGSGFLRIFDAVAFFKRVNQRPSQFGLLNVTEACWNSTTGGSCKNPGQWAYWDTLHPTTAMHEKIAKELTVFSNLS